jgi:hypothetical protein
MRDESFLEPFEKLMPVKEAQSIFSNTNLYDCFHAREVAIKKYGFAIPCEEAVIALVALSPLVEVGAGSGCWSRHIRASGGDIVAIDAGYVHEDRMSSWSMEGIEKMDALEAIRKYPDRNVFMCWPSYDRGWAGNVVQAMKPGLSVAYIGESSGGCTADDRFFEIIEADFDEVMSMAIPTWKGLHDYLTIYRKRIS